MFRSAIQRFVMFPLVRQSIWFLFEKAKVGGKELFPLSTYRRFAYRVNSIAMGGEPSPREEKPAPAEAKELEVRGLCRVEGIDASLLERVTASARALADERLPHTPNRPNPYVICNYQQMDRVDGLQEFLEHPHLWNIARHYLGVEPIVRNVDLLYSDIQPTLQGAQLYHLDNIAHRALRLILYVDNVGDQNGPFTTFDLPTSEVILRQTGYYDRRDYSSLDDAELEEVMAQHAPVRLTGESQSVFLADTCRCLHHGSRVYEGYRLAIFATFCSPVQTNVRWLRFGVADKSLAEPQTA